MDGGGVNSFRQVLPLNVDGDHCLASNVSVARHVKGLAPSIGGEHAKLLELKGGCWVEAKTAAAHNGGLALAGLDGAESLVEGQKAGGACCVNGKTRP